MIAAALLGQFDELIGIETLSSLHDISQVRTLVWSRDCTFREGVFHDPMSMFLSAGRPASISYPATCDRSHRQVYSLYPIYSGLVS